VKDLLTYIASNLVTNKDKLIISEIENNGITTFTIGAEGQDVGRIIGKGGKIIKAIRSIMRMAALSNGKKTFVEVKPLE